MPLGPSLLSMGVSTSFDTNGDSGQLTTGSGYTRSSPCGGGGPPVGWWRGTGGLRRARLNGPHISGNGAVAHYRIGKANRLCPPTMPRMVPHRPEELRVGKEWVRTCRSWLAPV